MVAVNLGAPMRLVRHLSPSMVKNREGTIINIGDVEALRPAADEPAYAASKNALHGWSSSIYHVRDTCITWIRTCGCTSEHSLLACIPLNSFT